MAAKSVNVHVYSLNMWHTPMGWYQHSMEELGVVTLPVNWTVRNLYKELRKNGWLTTDHVSLEDTTEWDFGYELCKRNGQPFLFLREESEVAV